MRTKPRIAITMGDPAGVGPEVCLKAAQRGRLWRFCIPFVVGDRGILSWTARELGLRVPLHPVGGELSRIDFRSGIGVLDLRNVPPRSRAFGRLSALFGRASAQYIERGAWLALEGKVSALVTAPIHKEALHAAGYPYPGHTEFLAELTGAEEPVMLLVHGRTRIAHVTAHCSLREACRRVKKGRTLRVIRLLDSALRRLGIPSPHLAVAGLNPHGGEGGLFGWEEVREIGPAVEAARAEGFRVEGPLPPDTVFAKHRGGLYDGVVAMYHDQGHIPGKLAAFSFNREGRGSVRGVNVTLGLPIVRTSVEHGTGFDIAGQGVADPRSLEDAVALAARLSGEPPPRAVGRGLRQTSATSR